LVYNQIPQKPKVLGVICTNWAHRSGGRVQVETPLIPLILRAAAWPWNWTTAGFTSEVSDGFSHFQGKIWGFVGEIVVDIWDKHQQLGQPINLLI